MSDYITFVLPTHNEEKNIISIIQEILSLNTKYLLEIIVVDDNSNDRTQSLVRELSKKDSKVRLINRVGRYGLSSAICEGCLNATGEIIAVMDSDGQHEVKSVYESIDYLLKSNNDLIIGSRFAKGSSIEGLSKKRKKGSSFANYFARFTLSRNYGHLSDFMSGCCAFKRNSCINYLKKIDVSGFKFLYELLSLSKGKLKVNEIPLNFQSRKYGYSKLDYAVIWDFFVSAVHSLTKRLIPRRAISFGFVGATGILVQLSVAYFLLAITKLTFFQVLIFAGVSSASSNFLINNLLTFRNARLQGINLISGLMKFLIVSSIPILANIGLASSIYQYVTPNKFLSQMAGIIVVYIWNYAASSKFVWKD
tara:strand:+ start:799 stop:1893 length:1095 start_codon:yes stop_codon:yes gene_type:complete